MYSQNLRAFLAATKSGSFSAAAQALHLTQPAVSKRIASLEAPLDRSRPPRLPTVLKTFSTTQKRSGIQIEPLLKHGFNINILRKRLTERINECNPEMQALANDELEKASIWSGIVLLTP